MSIFQAGESIQISNNSLERRQEEEDQEDERRRNKELENILEHGFNDLEENDEEEAEDTTMGSSLQIGGQEAVLQYHNMNNNNHDPRCLPQTAQQEHQKQTNFLPQQGNPHDFENEIHQLRMLLESRNIELENIKRMAGEEYQKRDELEKRFKIMEAELDRTLAAKKNTYELLVESKEKCSNLENTIAKLKNEKKSLEEKNSTLEGNLETVQTLLTDVQRKYDMVERDLNLQNDRNSERKRKEIEERYRAEVAMMQQQVEQLTDNLERKSSELNSMTARYHALQSSHEKMLVEKSTRIQDLSSALNDAQKQCDELMSKQDYFQENLRLQKLVASLQEEIKILKERIDQTNAELNVMDSVLQQHNTEDTPSPLMFTQSNVKIMGSTPFNTIERMNNLKEELYRSLGQLKQKREEVQKLQSCLQQKEDELRDMKEEENKSLVQINILKEQNCRLDCRLKALEEEYDQLSRKEFNKSGSEGRVKGLLEEIERLRDDKAKLSIERDEVERQRFQLEMDYKKLEGQLQNVEVDLEELKQEHQSLKRNYEEINAENQQLKGRETADQIRLELEKHKLLLKDAQSECERLKNLYVQISSEKNNLSYEMEKLRNTDAVKELQELKEKLAGMQRALQLAEVKSSELSKLLESEKLCHELEVQTLKEQNEKDKAAAVKEAKESLNQCTKCMDYIAEVTKFEIENLKLGNTNSIQKKEIDDLNQELKKARSLISELQEKLTLFDQQEEVINGLKSKALKFEEYVKSHSSSSERTSVTSSSKQEKSVCTSPEMARQEIKQMESRVRGEMSKIFTQELKGFHVKLQQSEEKYAKLLRESEKISAELHERENEVELLKRVVLAEREKFQELIKDKDLERENAMKKLKQKLHKCREELHIKTEKLGIIGEELKERQTQIEAERKSMKAVMAQWESQRKDLNELENEWKIKLEELKKSHKMVLDALNTKYSSAKHTALNYKRYAEEKEAHMLKEYERLKLEYEESLTKIEARLAEAMEKKEKELREAKSMLKRQESQPLKSGTSGPLVAGGSGDDSNKENKSRNTHLSYKNY